MSRLILVCTLFFTSLFFTSYSYALNDTDIFLRIDQSTYNVGDFKMWWEHFRDDTKQKIDGIDTYIDWLLLLNEAKKMELDSLPEYKRKEDIFISSRILMLYKNEEIDSKIILPDSLLYETYLDDYVPRRLVSLIECNNFELAKKIMDYAKNDLNMENIIDFADQYQKDYVVHSSKWIRPLITPEKWKHVLKDLNEKSLSTPFLLDNEKTGVLFIEEVHLANDIDYEDKKEIIFIRLRKKMSQELTQKLLNRLKKKYNVIVNQELIDKIDLFAPDPSSLDDAVITSEKSVVKVQYLIEQCMRNKVFLKMKNREDKNIQKGIKNQMVDAMVSNSLVSWEASAQKYEEKQPFKGELLFHNQYKLYKAIEKHIYSEVFVTQDQVNSFYTENQHIFTKPENVNIVLLSGSKSAIFKVWTKTLVGADLKEEAPKHGVSIEMASNTQIPLRHLQPETIKVLESLSEGDVSSPYTENTFTKLIQLVSRDKSAVEPLVNVQDRIIKMLLTQAKDTQRKEYIDRLKKNYKITINNTNWQKLQTEVSQ